MVGNWELMAKVVINGKVTIAFCSRGVVHKTRPNRKPFGAATTEDRDLPELS